MLLEFLNSRSLNTSLYLRDPVISGSPPPFLMMFQTQVKRRLPSCCHSDFGCEEGCLSCESWSFRRQSSLSLFIPRAFQSRRCPVAPRHLVPDESAEENPLEHRVLQPSAEERPTSPTLACPTTQPHGAKICSLPAALENGQFSGRRKLAEPCPIEDFEML